MQSELLPQDAIRYWHEPVLGGIDLLMANCLTHRFARHAHEEFVLAVFERGAEHMDAEGGSVVATAGSVLLIPPGIAHTGRSATADGWSYRAFYPRADLVHDVSADMFRDRVRAEALPLGLYADRRLFRRLLQAHRGFCVKASGLDLAVELVGALRVFLAYAAPNAARSRPGNESGAVAMAREFIHAHYADPISGAEIAAEVGLSLPHLMRVFCASTGVPINVYLNTVRLGHARKRLRAGEPAAGVAAGVGFADQSHLIRRFREAYGVTPGQYIRDSAMEASFSLPNRG